MQDIFHNIKTILSKIDEYKAQYHKDNVTLLCVSKTKPVEDIKAAYEAGQRHFGENYVQESEEKIPLVKDELKLTDTIWHFIGPIQSNKTKIIANLFDIVESVDREKIAKRLNEQRDISKGPLDVLIQVNISSEGQKSGCSFDEAQNLVAFIQNNCPNLRLRGFMGIALDTDNVEELKKEFSALYNLFVSYKERIEHFDILSLGMTHDMEYAIACSSTQVRIGTAIFGPRIYHK